MSSKTGRRPRAETAELVRQSAVRLLQERGLQGFANSVRLDDALALLEQEQGIRLTHGSVYGRIWSDQRDFQLDVVAATISRYDGSEIAAAIAGPTGRRGRTASAPLVGAFTRASAAARASRPWNLWLGARTAVVSTPEQDDDERLALALATAREQVVASVAAALHTLIPLEGAALDEGGEARASTFVTLLVGASLDDDSSGDALLLQGLT